MLWETTHTHTVRLYLSYTCVSYILPAVMLNTTVYLLYMLCIQTVNRTIPECFSNNLAQALVKIHSAEVLKGSLAKNGVGKRVN